MGGLRKELDLYSEEEDVCGFVGMVEDVYGYGGYGGSKLRNPWPWLMRLIANGASFLGCRGWMWVVGVGN